MASSSLGPTASSPDRIGGTHRRASSSGEATEGIELHDPDTQCDVWSRNLQAGGFSKNSAHRSGCIRIERRIQRSVHADSLRRR